MSEQLLSADPQAGLLSTDPKAGVAAAPPPIPRDARGRPVVSSDLGEGTSTVDKLNEMLGPLAHPQTLTDFARLLTLPVDSVKKALVGALSMTAAKSAAQTGASALANGAVKGAAAVGDVVDPDVVGVVSPRAGKVIQIAQKLRDRAAAARPSAPASPMPAAAVPPTIGEAVDTPIPVVQTAARATPDEVLNASRAAAPTNALPNQKLLNELAIQARRAGVKLTAETEQAAIDAVNQGATPAEAVQAVATPAAAAPAAAAEPAPTWTPTKLTLTAEEQKLGAKLLAQGKTDAEIRSAIETARTFQKRYGTPTPTAAQTRFAKGTRGGAR